MKRVVFSIIFVLFLPVATAITLPTTVEARELSERKLEERRIQDIERKKARQQRRKRQGRTSATEPEDAEKITIGLLSTEKDVPPMLSNLDPILQDEAIFGARLAIEDNNTTGAFTGQTYELEEAWVKKGEDPKAAFAELVAKGAKYIIVRTEPRILEEIISHPEADRTLIFNVAVTNNRLRNEGCRPNFFHTIPSKAMYADALTQFLVKKNWKKTFIIYGTTDADEEFAKSLKRSLKRFGAKNIGEKKWDLTHDLRRTARKEVPVFTKKLGKFDILLMADENGEFGEYFSWNTWQPKLIAGTQGLRAVSWHRTHEQWGAAQMQNRFRRAAGRWMTQVDYAAWVAVRSIGEAMTRLPERSAAEVAEYLRSDKFGIAAYKGLKVSYRPWNNQLRQRILLAIPRALVSHSPQPGFLHKGSDLDTLGFDREESKCRF